jgi:hypothetical protein
MRRAEAGRQGEAPLPVQRLSEYRDGGDGSGAGLQALREAPITPDQLLV